MSCSFEPRARRCSSPASASVRKDSGFLRTFSLLVIAVARRDTRERFLSEREWRRILESIVSCCERERDLRPHVDDKGWAHAIAHAADVVDELARSRYASMAD